MLTISDICDGARYCEHDLAGYECLVPCDECRYARCSCGLPWRPGRGRHTTTGLWLSHEAVARIYAREAEAAEVEARREREREDVRARRRMTIGGGR